MNLALIAVSESARNSLIEAGKSRSLSLNLESFESIFDLLEGGKVFDAVVMGFGEDGRFVVCLKGKSPFLCGSQEFAEKVFEGVSVPDEGSIARDFMEVLIASAKEVLSSMAGMEFNEEGLIFGEEYDVSVDVSGVIGFSGFVEGGSEFTGSLAVSASEDLARSIVSGMLMLSPDEVGEEEVKDGMGEVVNMVLGNAKVSSGKKFELSIPTVVVGKEHELWGKSQAVTVMGVLSSPEGQRLYLRLFLERKKEG